MTWIVIFHPGEAREGIRATRVARSDLLPRHLSTGNSQIGTTPKILPFKYVRFVTLETESEAESHRNGGFFHLPAICSR